MADKRKKHHHPTEDIQEGEGESVDDIRSVVELLSENQLWKDEEDREYRARAEKREERAGEVPEVEWSAIIAAKLSGKVGATWQDLCGTTDEYQMVKGGVLKVCGYTPKLAGEAFFLFQSGIPERDGCRPGV